MTRLMVVRRDLLPPKSLARSFSAAQHRLNQAGVLTKSGDLHVYRERKVLPYSQQQLYSVIADIDSYSSFIPFLTSSKVLNGESGKKPKMWLDSDPNDKGKVHRLQAELGVGFAGFAESYVSNVECRKWDQVTATANAPALFKTLATKWELNPVEGSEGRYDKGTLVGLNLMYEFASPLYAIAASSVFEQVSAKVMKGFEKRCSEIYPS